MTPLGKWVQRSIAAAAAIALQIPSAIAGDAKDAPDDTRLLSPSLTYDGTAVSNVHGGLRTGATYVGNLHLKLTAELASIGLPGTSAYADLLNLHGGRPEALVGDAQGVSNLAGPNGTQIEELWVQHNWATGKASLLVGIYDLNSEFYKLHAAGLFAASSFGIGPEFAQSGVEGPSIFPRTSAGIRFGFKPSDRTLLRVAVLDGVPVVRPDGSRAAFQSGDGLLAVAEVAVLSRDTAQPQDHANPREQIGRLSALSPYQNKLALGAWRYSSTYPDLSETDAAGNPTRHRGSSGAYLIGEHLLVGEEGSSGPRASGFVQAGVGDARVDRFGSYIGAGVVVSGFAPLRESDQFGVSIAHARNGSHYERAQATQTSRTVAQAETLFEMTYLTQPSEHLTVQPALQYVVHPNTDPVLPNAWVFQLRFELGY